MARVTTAVFEPGGPRTPMDPTRRQRGVLPPELAGLLAALHRASGLSYRQAGRILGVDHSHWRRMGTGERRPSRRVAMRIIETFDLPDDIGEALLEASST